MTTGTRQAEVLLRDAYAVLESGDLDAVYDLLTEDFIANLPGLAEPLHGREAWKAGAQAMLEAFPDLRVEIEDLLVSEDRVAVRVRLSGTHSGAFQGVAATHRRVSFPSLEMYRMRDGRIAEEWVAPDIALLMRQLTQGE
ncbi:ester cyclase [Nocardiopsis oceani]